MRSIVLLMFTFLLLTSCNSNINSQIESPSASITEKPKPTENHLQSKIYDLTSEVESLKARIAILEQSEFDNSLLDTNIHSYQGLMWGEAAEASQYSIYFKSMLQRVLFDYDYLWFEEISGSEDPVNEIRETEDCCNRLLGVTFISPVTSTVTTLPADIIEVWFNIKEKVNYMYLKTNDNNWHSFIVKELEGDFKILSTILEVEEYIEPDD